MPGNIKAAGNFILITSLLFLYSPGLYSIDSVVSESHPGSIIVPSPEPFSLDVRSAIYCINLLKNSRFLEKNGDSGKYNIVEVNTVWSWFLEYDESYPEGYRKRYDIIVNGEPLDWDNSFIEFGGEMLNLRLLFLYRNQYPPDGLEYYFGN